MTQEELDKYYKENNIVKDTKKPDKIKSAYDQYANYIIILVLMIVQVGISVLSAVDGDIANAFPKTAMEWVLWSVLRVVNAVVAFMIFDAFVKEGEKRGKLSAQYKAAEKRFFELFNDQLAKEVKTQSPRQYLSKTRGMKAIKLVISAVLTGASISLSTIQANWTGIIGTVISILMMVVWGYQKMLQVEEYFTTGYMEYVVVLEYKLKLKQEEKPNGNNDQRDSISQPGGTGSVSNGTGNQSGSKD